MAGELPNGFGVMAPEPEYDPNAPMASYAPPPPVAPAMSSMPPSAAWTPAPPDAPPPPPPVPSNANFVSPPVKKKPQDMHPDEYRAAVASALDGGDPNSRDVSASVATPTGTVVGYSAGSGGREQLAMGRGAQGEMRAKYEAPQTAAFKNVLNDYVQAEQESDMWSKEAQKQQFVQDQLEDQKARRAQELQALRDDMDKRSTELAQTVIDPDRKERERWSSGRAFLDMISAGLLTFGLGAPGLESVTNRIRADNEADIQSQKDQFAAKQQGLKGKETIYEKMMQQYGNEDDATAATRMAGLEQTKLQAQAWAAKAKGPEAQKAFNTLVGNLDMQKHGELQAHMKTVGARGPTYAVKLKNGMTVNLNQQQYTAYALENEHGNDAASRQAGVSMATEGAKGQVKARDDINQQTRDFGKEIAKDAPALSTLNDLESALRATEITGPQRATAIAGIQNPTVRKWLHGAQAANRDQVVQRFAKQIISDISGSGVSNEERKDLTQMIQGAGDTESILNAARIAKNTINARRKTLEAGYDPQVIDTYNKRSGQRPTSSADADVRSEE